MTDLGKDGRTSPLSPGVAPRRQRAPTITIDTSAVSPSVVEADTFPLQPLSDHPSSLQGDQTANPNPNTTQISNNSPSELRPAQSFESRESRPKSAHNVSSPTSKWNDLQSKNFLSVPETRSRGNSVDSDDQATLQPLTAGTPMSLRQYFRTAGNPALHR